MSTNGGRIVSLWLAIILVGVLAHPGGTIAAGEGGQIDLFSPVYFADPKLKAAVEAKLGTVNPTPIDMFWLLDLFVYDQGISSLTGLEYAPNLLMLSLNNNPIRDISALSGLTNLMLLDLSFTQVSDISPLRSLQGLTVLAVPFAQVSDISALAELKSLTMLFLFENEIWDISPLAGLTGLTALNLGNNEISDISSLATLTRLTELDLSTNHISDVSALSHLTSLTTLSLGNNDISDISPLSKLTSLKDLSLLGNRIANLSALATMENLTSLTLLKNEVSDVAPLASLRNLTDLWLTGNNISDVSPLAQLAKLTTLGLGVNRISDISPLSRLTNLGELYLMENQISDISALIQLANLRVLSVHTNRISDISPMEGLTCLTILDLADNEVSDISCLAHLPSLGALGLSDNPLSCSAYQTDIPDLLRQNPALDIVYDPAPAQCTWKPEGRIFFVDARAGEGHDGSSWSRAFSRLQDAMAVAAWGDEIRVAQGIYTPDRGGTARLGDRYATFQLKNGRTLRGGYAGLGAVDADEMQVDPNTRNVSRYATILSGDLAGNDRGDWTDPSRGENSIHVVSCRHADDTAVLDGFTITAGYANDQSEPINAENLSGGGMMVGELSVTGVLSLIVDGSPLVRDCTFRDNYAFLYGGGLHCDAVTLVDCTFIRNHAGLNGGGVSTDAINTTVDNCLFSANSAAKEGGGIYALTAEMRLTNSRFESNRAVVGDAVCIRGLGAYGTEPISVDNVAISEDRASAHKVDVCWLNNIHVRLDGLLDMRTGRLNIGSSLFDGIGRIRLGEQATLKIAGAPGAKPTIVRADIDGPGDIEIDAGQQLVIGGDSVVNLSGLTGHIPDAGNGGRITVKGTLVVQDRAAVESTHVSVKLFDVNTPNDIQHNDITLLEASTGFGGEFFVSGQARVRYNNIISEGDRYLDLDPDPYAKERPAISNNRITVIIKEGTLGSQGTLLELRAKDYDAGAIANPLGSSGAFQVAATSPGFTEDPSENWVLEKLILEPNSKVNLTNRQGFEFQELCDSCERSWETVYIKELVMGPNSILNAGLQTLYYQRLIDPNGNELLRDEADPFAPLANGARFQDIPVLGFSLGIIAMNDPTPPPHNEFDIRVRRRLTDPTDEQPDPLNPTKIGSIVRMDSDPGIPTSHGGVMEMRTQAPKRDSARSVAAKGAFARAGDEDITIEFQYLFREAPQDEAEIIVSLSDDPEVSQKLIPVASIRPPQPGRPGSIGSGIFAVFSGTFRRGNLNFKRGTYVELELRGKAARCWIDNWDPKVYCNTCGDYDGMGFLSINDYYMLLAEYGTICPGAGEKGCLDLLRDGCVGAEDLSAWDTMSGEGGWPLSACRGGIGGTEPGGVPHVRSGPDLAGPLVMLGKSRTPNADTILVTLDTDPNGAKSKSLSGTGRLVSDSGGRVYQIDPAAGIICDDGTALVAPKDKIDIGEGRTVTVGFHQGRGLLLSDAVFDPVSPNLVYIVPVLVKSEDSPVPYQAAARLKCTGTGDYRVEALYGRDPAGESSTTVRDANHTRDFVYEPDLQHLHEVEIDATGRNLFVLSSCWENQNDVVVIYDTNGGDPHVAWLNDPAKGDPNLIAPTAMVVSSQEEKLYLASSARTANNVDDLATKVYCFSLEKEEQQTLGLRLDKTIEIVGPEPDRSLCRAFPQLGGLDASVSMITSMVGNRTNDVLYVVGYTAPRFADGAKWPYQGTWLFTTPMMAVIKPQEGTVDMIDLRDGKMALPLSIVWTGRTLPGH